MERTGFLFICTIIFTILAGMMFSASVGIPLAWAFACCALVCMSGALISYLEGK